MGWAGSSESLSFKFQYMDSVEGHIQTHHPGVIHFSFEPNQSGHIVHENCGCWKNSYDDHIRPSSIGIQWRGQELWTVSTDIRYNDSKQQSHSPVTSEIAQNYTEASGLWWLRRLLTVTDVFMVRQLSARPVNALMSLTVVTILYSPRLAGHINITHNYHPQRKESINNLGWNRVWMLMRGEPSRILIRGDTFRATLTFLPKILVKTALDVSKMQIGIYKELW